MESNAMRRANILAVDDQHANLVALDAVLGGEFNVIRASSGPQAIAILEASQDVDVILMDAQMPGMDGFEAASRIKAMDGCQDIPIAFITAVYNEDPFVKQGYRVGAVDYFSKPFDPDILKVKVGIYASFRQRAAMLKERARQIRESEELLRVGERLSSTLEQLRVGVITTDVDGRLRQCNREIHDIWADLKPASGFEEAVFGWWDRDGELIVERPNPVSRALARGSEDTPEIARLEIGSVGGIPKTILCTAAPLRGFDGTIAGAVVVVHDATERKQIEHDLQQRISRLVSAPAPA